MGLGFSGEIVLPMSVQLLPFPLYSMVDLTLLPHIVALLMQCDKPL